MTHGMSLELRKLIALRGAWQFLLLQPVAVPFFLSNGLTASEIYWLQGVFFTALCLSDIPAGVVAGRFGERGTLLAACVLKGIGGILLCFPSKFGIFLAYAIIGVANALYSAVESTLVFSNLPAQGSRLQAVEKVQSFSQGVIFSVVLISGLAGSAVAHEYGFRVLIVANAVFAWSSFALASLLAKAGPRPPSALGARHYRGALGLLQLEAHGAQVVLIASGVTIVATVPIFIQNRLVEEGAQLLSFGAVFIFQQLLAMAFGFATARSDFARALAGRLGPVWICTLWVGGLLFLHFGSTSLAVLALIQVELARIALLVNVTSKFHCAVPNELRTTVVSILNFASRLYGAAVLGLVGGLSRLWPGTGADTLVLLLLVLAAMVVSGRNTLRSTSA